MDSFVAINFLSNSSKNLDRIDIGKFLNALYVRLNISIARFDLSLTNAVMLPNCIDKIRSLFLMINNTKIQLNINLI
jgi:hypothetical protein